MSRRIAVFLCLLLATAPANSADFRIADGVAYMIGPIVAGDYQRFEALIRSASPGQISTIRLRSPGGDVVESMKIGRLIRSLYLVTDAPIYDAHWKRFKSERWRIQCGEDSKALNERVPCTCASACFLVWAAGAYRQGQVLQLHRIRFEADFFGSLSPSDAERRYKEGLIIVQDYLREMEMPDFFYAKMVSTPSNSVIDVTPEESLHIGYSTSFNEWLIARCAQRPAGEEEYKCWLREHEGARRSRHADFLAKR